MNIKDLMKAKDLSDKIDSAAIERVREAAEAVGKLPPETLESLQRATASGFNTILDEKRAELLKALSIGAVSPIQDYLKELAGKMTAERAFKESLYDIKPPQIRFQLPDYAAEKIKQIQQKKEAEVADLAANEVLILYVAVGGREIVVNAIQAINNNEIEVFGFDNGVEIKLIIRYDRLDYYFVRSRFDKPETDKEKIH